MPRKPGPHNERDSKVLAFRVPNEVAEAVLVASGGEAGKAEWLRLAVRQALTKVPLGAGTAQALGFAEGKKQGWAFANAAFREALNVAAEKLK